MRITIIVGKDETIDRALKRFKRKWRQTQIMKQIRDRKQYTKKSTKRRLEKQNAIYNNKKESYE
tara:strand:+ start:4507 stop:4698 length:192 start_codon:yes stop_codon:yes gene_type:complete